MADIDVVIDRVLEEIDLLKDHADLRHQSLHSLLDVLRRSSARKSFSVQYLNTEKKSNDLQETPAGRWTFFQVQEMPMTDPASLSVTHFIVRI